MSIPLITIFNIIFNNSYSINDFDILVVLISVSIILSIFSLDLVRGLSIRFNAFDRPNERSSHVYKVPTLGGLAIGIVWLIISAMVFGGVMDAIGALSKISKALLSLASSTFGLFASTVASCLALNVTASDQYLAIVVPGKMFKKAYEDKGLAPENLSRTLEDSGTVTSVLVPWNTCGAYQSGVLGVAVEDYFVYAFFNWISPFMTLLVAGISFKIKEK